MKELPSGFRAPEPYHYVLVPLDGGAPERRPLPQPRWLSGMVSRVAIEIPVFARHLWAGIAASGALLVAYSWRRRRDAHSA